MSNARQNEQALNDIANLFKSIKEINEDFYHNRKNKENTVKGLAFIKQKLKTNPEYVFHKLDKIRLTGTWIYCDQISPFEYSLLQSNHETWKYMIDCLQEYPSKEKISTKLLDTFHELQKRNIQGTDLHEAGLQRFDKIAQYVNHQNFEILFDDLSAQMTLKTVTVTLKTRRNNQFCKNHLHPTLFSNPIQCLTGDNSFKNFYRDWCASVELSIVKLKNHTSLNLI